MAESDCTSLMPKRERGGLKSLRSATYAGQCIVPAIMGDGTGDALMPHGTHSPPLHIVSLQIDWLAIDRDRARERQLNFVHAAGRADGTQ